MQRSNYIYKILLLFMLMIVPQSLMAAINLTMPSDATIDLGSSHSAVATTSKKIENDPPGCSMSVSPSNPGLSISRTANKKCTVSGTPTSAGTYTITVNVIRDNSSQTNSDSYQLTVNAVNTNPAITGITGATTITEDTALDLTVNGYDADGDALTYSLESIWPSGSNIQISGNRITGSNLTVRTYYITVKVDDGNGGSATHDIQVTVEAKPNTPPVLTLSDQSATVGEAFSYTPTATDADGDTLSFVNYWVPNGLSFDTATGTISGTPTARGDYTIEITAQDGQGGEDKKSFILAVAPVASDPDFVSPTPSQGSTHATYDVGTAFSITIKAEPGITSYKLSGSSTDYDGIDNLVINATTGVITGTFTEGGRTNNIKVYAQKTSDDYSLARTFNIKSNGVSTTPQFVDPTPNEGSTHATYDVGTAFSITIKAEPGITIYRLSSSGTDDSGIDDLVINATTGVITGTFTEGGRTNNIKVYAQKTSGDYSLARTFYIKSNSASTPQWVSPTPDEWAELSYDVGQAISIPVKVEPDTGITFRLSSTSEDDGMSALSMDTTTGTITGTFSEADKSNDIKYYAYKDGSKVLTRYLKLKSNPMVVSVYSCPGESVTNIDGATNSASKSYTTGVDVAEVARYFQFTTAVDGEMTIRQSNNKAVNGYLNHKLYIGTSCDTGSEYTGGASKDDSKTFTVTGGTTYYVKVKENNSKNVLNFDISFDFVASVNNPPILAPIPDQNVSRIDGVIALSIGDYVTKTEDDNITSYTLTGTLPSGIVFDSTTGAFSGSSAAEGSFSLSVTASDKDGASNSESFNINLGGTPPVIQSISRQTVAQNSAISIDLNTYIEKTDNDDIISHTLSGDSLPNGLSFSSGVISGTATEAGDFNFTLQVKDIDGDSNLVSFMLVVQSDVVAENGLNASYYNNTSFTGTPSISRVDANIDWDWGSGNPGGGLGNDNFSVKWSGYIYIPEDGEYTFSMKHDDGITLTVDGEQLYTYHTWSSNTYKNATTKTFTKGYYPIEYKFVENGGGAHAHLRWKNNNSISSDVIVPSVNLFTSIPIINYVENADDLCYGKVSSQGIDMGMMQMLYTVTTPINSLTDTPLSDVKVLFEDSSNINFSAFSDCGIDDVSKNVSGECSKNSAVTTGAMALFSEGVLFDPLPDYSAKDTHSVYTKVMFSVSMLSTNTVKASYKKNGISYRGVVQECQSEDNSSLDNEDIPTDDANVLPASCGGFEDGLQTRADNSKVDFSSGNAKLFNNPDETLNTYNTPLNGDSANALTCQDMNGGSDSVSCIPSNQAAKVYDDPIGGMKYPSVFSLARPVTSSTLDKEYGGNTIDGEKLTEAEYGTVSSRWGSGTTTIPFEIPNILALGKIENGAQSALVKFTSGNGGVYQFTIGSIETKERGTFNTTDRNAKNIKIGTFSGYGTPTQGSAYTTVDLEATQTIKIESLYTSHSSSYTLKAQYININTLKDISGTGSQSNTINIIADYIDIGELSVGVETTLNITPYTAGKEVVVKMNKFDTNSNNVINFSAGTYYIKALSVNGSGEGYKWNVNGKVKLIIEEDLDTDSKIFINSDGTGDICSDSHSATDLFIFAYGNIDVRNGSRIVGMLYAKGDVTLGSASYIKGAVSANDKVLLENATEVCYDSDLVDDYGKCDENVTEDPEPDMVQCGIFPSALQTYQTLYFGGGSGSGSDTTVINVENIVAQQTNPAVEADGTTTEATCDGKPCDVELPYVIDYNVPFKTTLDKVTYSIGSDTTVNSDNAGNYNITAKNTTLTFSAKKAYSDGSRNYMMIGDLDSSKGNVKYVFEEGDYYIKSWKNSGNGLVIEGKGRVRIFLNQGILWEKNDVTIAADSGIASNFFIFSTGNIDFSSNGASKFDMTAFFYTKGNFTLNGNSDSGNGITGGITAVGNISLSNNQKFTYDPRGLDDLGMGECIAYVNFSKPTYRFVEPVVDSGIPEIVYKEVNITLTQAVDHEVVVSYETFDGDPFDEDLHAKVYLDYQPPNPNPRNYTIPMGSTSVSVTTTIKRDAHIELEETFYAKLKMVSGGQDVGLGRLSETSLVIEKQTIDEVPVCFEDDFNGALDDQWRVLKSVGGFTPGIDSTTGRLRLTDRGKNVATAVTRDIEFSAYKNLIEMEYFQYAYGGCESGSSSNYGGGIGKFGADGIVMVLFDSSVGHSPEPGSYGGSMGYAQGHGKDGFEGGWLGLGIDEYGNFGRNNEGRVGGYSSSTYGVADVRNSIVIRGSSGELSDKTREDGYEYLAAKIFGDDDPVAAKNREIDSSFPGHKYKLRIDARDTTKLLISLYRDKDGNGYDVAIPEFDAKDPSYNQSETPAYVRLAWTSGSGGGCNYHEVDEVLVKGICKPYILDLFNKGPFSAWDTYSNNRDASIVNKVIQTKHVSETFDLDMASLDDTRFGWDDKGKISTDTTYFPFYNEANANLVINKVFKNAEEISVSAKYELVDASDPANPIVITSNYDNGDGGFFNADFSGRHPTSRVKKFKVDRAYKNLRVKFTMCADYDYKTDRYKVYPFYGCKPNVFAEPDEEGSNKLAYRIVYSDDAFAVRPVRFTSTLTSNTSLEAMASIPITFTAESAENKPSLGYNETQGNSVAVLFSDLQNGTCTLPTLSPNIDFVDGVSDGNFTLSNIGDYSLSIMELEGSEYAWIDNADTPWEERQIPRLDINPISINLSRLDLSVTQFGNVRTSPYIHRSDLNLSIPAITRANLSTTMLAQLQFTITAMKADDSIATNYNGNCAAQNSALVIDYETTINHLTTDRIQYLFFDQENNISTMPIDTNKTINDNISRTEYNNGVYSSTLYFNFLKDLNTPMNPFEMNLQEVSIRDLASNMVGRATDNNPTLVNTVLTFIYSRIRASDDVYEDITENVATTPLLSDIYCDLDRTVCDRYGLDTNNTDIDEANWYINRDFNSTNTGSGMILSVGYATGVATLNPSVNITLDRNGTNPNVTLTNTLQTEQTVEVILRPEVWLRYNPDDAMGFPRYIVEFMATPQEGWSGVGETGDVVEGNASISTTRNRINW